MGSEVAGAGVSARSETAPSHEALLARVTALLPEIDARRAEADRIRDIPAETITALSQAGLMRVYQPARWGGYESDPRTFFAVQNAIAEICPSSAWVYGVLSVQALLIGSMDDRAQAEIWGQDDSALACSSFAPVGTAEPVEGGFRLSGRWSFSSGCTFAQWAMVGARITSAPPPDGPPSLNLFLISRSDFEIIDVWNAFGLRATGSNDLVAKDVFVPAHRHVVMDPGLQNVPSAIRPLPPLYRMPWLYLFTSVVSNFAVGAARGALKAFVEIARGRVSPMTGKAAKDDPATVQAVARLMAEIESAEAMYDRHIARFQDYVARDAVIPMHEALLYRTQLTSQLRKITAHLDDCLLLQGSRATDMGSRVTRTWLDLWAAQTHIGNDPTLPYTLLGSMSIAEETGGGGASKR